MKLNWNFLENRGNQTKKKTSVVGVRRFSGKSRNIFLMP